MPEVLGHPYPGEVLRTAQEVAEKLRPFYESANFSMFNAASEQAARLNKSLRTINAINVKCAKQLEVASALTRHIDPALCQALNKMPPMPAIPVTPMLGLEQQKLFNDLTTASQILQHTLGAKLDLLSLDRAMQVERVLSKLDLYVPNLADYDHIPLKDMLSTLIDCRPEEYADVLKKRFPRPKKHSKRKATNVKLTEKTAKSVSTSFYIGSVCFSPFTVGSLTTGFASRSLRLRDFLTIPHPKSSSASIRAANPIAMMNSCATQGYVAAAIARQKAAQALKTGDKRMPKPPS